MSKDRFTKDILGKKLRSLFMGAVLGMSAVTGAEAKDSPRQVEPQTLTAGFKNLTAGEKALVKSIFGDAVNVEIVKKGVTVCDVKSRYMEVGDGENIDVCHERHYSQDYSQETDVAKYGYFIHEITHIWQFQKIGGQNMFWCKEYYYPLDAKYSFSDYCIEQQASIIEDYARGILRGGSFRRIETTPENIELLRKVVEDQFPEARKTRLKIEAQREKKFSAAPGV